MVNRAAMAFAVLLIACGAISCSSIKLTVSTPGPGTPGPQIVVPGAVKVNDAPPQNGNCPDTHPIKGEAPGSGAKVYYLPSNSKYRGISATRCFATVQDANAAGYREVGPTQR